MQFASADLQEDCAIVLAAVQRHGEALYYAITTPLQRKRETARSCWLRCSRMGIQ
jgi:hypothetical protein